MSTNDRERDDFVVKYAGPSYIRKIKRFIKDEGFKTSLEELDIDLIPHKYVALVNGIVAGFIFCSRRDNNEYYIEAIAIAHEDRFVAHRLIDCACESISQDEFKYATLYCDVDYIDENCSMTLKQCYFEKVNNKFQRIIEPRTRK